MESFGEGIDIPGEKLQLIIIDKIPDVRRELIIDKRRDWYESSFGNEFQDYFLAHRARALHQKCGRLLRREDDFGGVIIVDQRLKKWKGNTLKQFAKLMEPYQIQVTNLDKACEEMKDFLIEFGPRINGVVHSFSSGLELARVAIEQGFFLGFNGMITFKNADNVREAVKLCPIDQLLIETDSPFLAPVPHRGKENAPFLLPFVLAKLAEIKGVSETEMDQKLTENAKKLFGLD
jgi:hypothetical protein